LSQLVAEQAGDADQDLVAGGVPEAVVDRLEVVDVEHREAERAGGPLSRQPLDLARQITPVVQARERVALGLLAQLGLQALQLARAPLQLDVRLGELPVLRGQRIAVAPRGGRLERRALEAELDLRELAERLALEFTGSLERVVGLLDMPGVAQRGGQRG